MTKIGFVDYYISEWHANNYVKWLAEANERLGTDYKVCYAWAELDKSPLDNVTTDEWCEKYGAEKCETVKEICEKSDVILILAPSNPETHLRLAQAVLPYGKKTFIDKTFAPDFATAEKIFSIAKEYNTPFFSTSALRYAKELDAYNDYDDIASIIITVPGSNFPEYSVHLVEMLVRVCTKKPVKLNVEKSGLTYDCTVIYEDETRAKLIFSPHYPYSIYADNGKDKGLQQPVASAFPRLMEAIINFFETGTLPFDPQQTLDCMKIREALIIGSDKLGEWIDL